MSRAVLRIPSLTEDIEEAAHTMETLAQSQISMKEVTDRLVQEEVKQFDDDFEKLLKATGR